MTKSLRRDQKTGAGNQSRVEAAGILFDQALPTLEKLRLITQAWEELGVIRNGAKSIPKFGEPAYLAEQGILQSQSSSEDEDIDFVKYSKCADVASFVNIPKRRRKDKDAYDPPWERLKQLHGSFNPIKRPRNSNSYRDPLETPSKKTRTSNPVSGENDLPRSPQYDRKTHLETSQIPTPSVPRQTLTLTRDLQESWERLRENKSFVGRAPEQLKVYLDLLQESTPEQLARSLEGFAVHGAQGLGQIESPSGYPLAMHVTFDDIRESVIRFKEARIILTGRRDSMEDMPSHGFVPSELIANNAIDLPSSIPLNEALSNLDNDIHPLFRMENFKENARDIYPCLKPALRLASKLLTERVVSLFWHTACFGKREIDSDLPKSFDGHLARRIREPVHWTPKGDEKVRDLLSTLAEDLTIDFTSKFEYPVDRYAEHGIIPAKWPLRPRNYSRIIFGQDTYNSAKKLAVLKMPDPMQVLRFHFLFGVILVHEIAHAVESRHKLASNGDRVEDGRCDNEAYYGAHEWCEAGRAWERTVFHGTFLPINKRVDAAHGLCIYDYPDEALTNFNSVDMQYIWAIQRKETWEREDLSPENFQIPRNGAVGTGSYFTPALFISDAEGDPHSQRIVSSQQNPPEQTGIPSAMDIAENDQVPEVGARPSRSNTPE